MSWLETISSVLGTGAGGAALAAAIYAGSRALESEMRSEAKKDIARFINNTAINPDSQLIANFILHAFETIFGPNHFSYTCARRSALATLSFLVVVSALVSLKYPTYIFDIVHDAYTGRRIFIRYASPFFNALQVIFVIFGIFASTLFLTTYLYIKDD
jgi:hypothetical protein